MVSAEAAVTTSSITGRAGDRVTVFARPGGERCEPCCSRSRCRGERRDREPTVLRLDRSGACRHREEDLEQTSTIWPRELRALDRRSASGTERRLGAGVADTCELVTAAGDDEPARLSTTLENEAVATLENEAVATLENEATQTDLDG